MNHSPLTLTGFGIQSCDIRGHKITAPSYWSSQPALIIRLWQTIYCNIFERNLALALVRNGDTIDDIQILRVFFPGFSYQIEYLPACIFRRIDDSIAHAPGEPAGYRLPFVGAVQSIYWCRYAYPFVRHTQRGRCHLGSHRKCALTDVLTSDPDGQGAIFG